MNNKHTQGQWRYDAKHNAICEGESYSHFCNTLIAEINPNMGEVTKANAKLIAAAPDLLEALKIASMYVSSVSDKSDWNIIQAAINKATL